MPPDEINLIFQDGMLFGRMERFIDGKSPAAALFNGPYYLAEQLGFRKVIDTTFMIAAMIKGSPDPEDIRRYFRAPRFAQRDIDLRPERYTHYYKNEFPDRFHAIMDTRRWEPGERIVFEPYSKEVFEESFDWIAKHKIFADERWDRAIMIGRRSPLRRSSAPGARFARGAGAKMVELRSSRRARRKRPPGFPDGLSCPTAAPHGRAIQDLRAGGLSSRRILIGCRCKSGQSRTVARTDAMISTSVR